MTTYITPTVPIQLSTFEGGLNSGELGLQPNESDDLANVEFDKFGSMIKRKGYLWLNANIIPVSNASIASNTNLYFDSCGTAFGTEIPHSKLKLTTHKSSIIT